MLFKTILSNVDDLCIQNSLRALHRHKNVIVSYLSDKLNVSCTSIITDIDEVLAYKEVDGFDNSIQMTAHEVVMDSIDALDALQSMFRRLMV